MFSSIGFYLSSKSLEGEYPKIGLLILGLFFGAFRLFPIIVIWTMEKFEFDGEKLIVKSIFNTSKKIIYHRVFVTTQVVFLYFILSFS